MAGNDCCSRFTACLRTLVCVRGRLVRLCARVRFFLNSVFIWRYRRTAPKHNGYKYMHFEEYVERLWLPRSMKRPQDRTLRRVMHPCLLAYGNAYQRFYRTRSLQCCSEPPGRLLPTEVTDRREKPIRPDFVIVLIVPGGSFRKHRTVSPGTAVSPRRGAVLLEMLGGAVLSPCRTLQQPLNESI